MVFFPNKKETKIASFEKSSYLRWKYKSELLLKFWQSTTPFHDTSNTSLKTKLVAQTMEVW